MEFSQSDVCYFMWYTTRIEIRLVSCSLYLACLPIARSTVYHLYIMHVRLLLLLYQLAYSRLMLYIYRPILYYGKNNEGDS